jgi:hypothetical protein
MQKIKRKILVLIFYLLVFGLLLYTRFFGLDWGLPYPMHPDERNMAVALSQLACKFKPHQFDLENCFNPHFFAYGQLPLYLSYFLIWVFKGFSYFGEINILFEEATIVLRFISALASLFSAVIVVEILKIITKKEKFFWWLMVIFSPFFIQFSHFGTTESLLTFFYLLLIFLSLLLFEKKMTFKKFIFLSSLVFGLSLATKVSSLIYSFLPIFAIFLTKEKSFYQKFFLIIYFFASSLIFFLIFSPHNFISWKDFISSLNYESAVALGKILVFYTKQFDYSLPIIFPLLKVIPFALGLIGFLGIFGFFPVILKNKKDKRLIFLGFSFLIYFLPNAFIFTKWTRFLAPIFPVILIFGILVLEEIKIFLIRFLVIFLSLILGFSYLSIYQKPDVRFSSSEWIFKNIPKNSYILSETANVIDIPILNPKIKNLNQELNKNYQIISFNFYDLDKNKDLQKELIYHLNQADYIFVPSRRIFANYTCFWPEKKNYFFDYLSYDKYRCESLKKEFPLLNQYYNNLFSGRLGFKKVAKFSSYPKISFFGKILFEFPDEEAEETWTVFDHPVIRIYKRDK